MTEVMSEAQADAHAVGAIYKKAIDGEPLTTAEQTLSKGWEPTKKGETVTWDVPDFTSTIPVVKDHTGAMITSHVERFTDCIDEVQPLFREHWEELGLFKDKMPLDPHYGYYAECEANGSALFLTLRTAGKLIGYFGGIVGPSPHYKSTLTCKMDLIYLAPEHRGLGAGKMLLDAVKAELKRRGVKLWWVGSKCHKPLDALLTLYGFELAETYYAMWTGDADGTA